MKRRQNWWFLIAAAFFLLTLATVIAGAHIYRWEAVLWLSCAISANVAGFIYSRMWSRD